MASESSSLDFVSAVLIIFASIVPAYYSVKLRGSTRILTIALAAFIGMHGLYHIVRMQGLQPLADGVFEPMSITVLIAFGITYVVVVSTHKNKSARSEMARK